MNDEHQLMDPNFQSQIFGSNFVSRSFATDDVWRKGLIEVILDSIDEKSEIFLGDETIQDLDSKYNLEPLYDIFSVLSLEYLKTLVNHQYLDCYKMYLNKWWPAVLRKGGDIDHHFHKNSDITGVFYLNVPYQDPDIGGFLRLYAGKENKILELPIHSSHSCNETVLHMLPCTNQGLMFPSLLGHDVSTYNGDEPRISISFDISIIRTSKPDCDNMLSYENTTLDPSTWKDITHEKALETAKLAREDDKDDQPLFNDIQPIEIDMDDLKIPTE